MKYHLFGDTMLHRLLFDQKYLELIPRYFDGLNGAFSQKDNYGTFLFWGLPKDTKYRVQLWRDGQKLKAKDGSFEVWLTPEGIHDAIERNELIPNTMLTFITLAFYYGMYLGGGPAQTLNLTKMKEAYIAMQHEYGDTESAEAIMDLPTKNLVISRPSLAYLDIPANDMRIPATGLDWILYGSGGSQWARILEATKEVTLAEIINRALPSFYAEFVPQAEKQADLSTITERDIEKFTGLSEKIPYIAQLS